MNKPLMSSTLTLSSALIRLIGSGVLIMSSLIVTGCGGSGEDGNVFWVDGTDLNRTVNKAGVYDIEVHGIRNDITITAGNTVGRLGVAGLNNRIYLSPSATIRHVEMTGRNHTLFVPPGFRATTRIGGENNDIIERR